MYMFHRGTPRLQKLYDSESLTAVRDGAQENLALDYVYNARGRQWEAGRVPLRESLEKVSRGVK
jgi:hypothetical protein